MLHLAIINTATNFLKEFSVKGIIATSFIKTWIVSSIN